MIIRSAFILIVAFSIAGCMDSMHGNQVRKSKFYSEGERLYFTGVSSTGEQMISIGGHHHMQMHGGSCVTCHGADKQGGARMWPRFWVVAPALTKDALSHEHNDGHAHASYDERSLRNAILKGINPEGEKLHETMPKWKMSDRNLDALVHFLLGDGEHKH